MGLFANLLGDIGIGSGTDTGGNANYSFDQQQKNFIKLQFKYGLTLKKRLEAGTISQAYYDANFWLTTQTLDAPYNGWYDEFKAAINSEDLNWLAKQVGETTDVLVSYMGDALTAVAKTAGSIVGTAISSTSSGLIDGFFGSLGITGWLVVIGAGVGIYWSYKNGYLQKVVKKGFVAAVA